MKLPLIRAIWFIGLATALTAQAKMEEWQDPQGNKFTAEAAEPLGPFALFRTPTGGGRRLPWRALSPADCVRFNQQAGHKPEAAAKWSDAHGELTGRLRGHLRQFAGANAVSANLDSRPEPELLIVFFVDAAQGSSWDMLTRATAPYNKLVAKHPGVVAGVQYGTHQGGPDLYNGLAMRANLPWLMIDYEEQRRVIALTRLAPGRRDCALFALSRDGVPVFAITNPDEAAVAQFFTDAEVLLTLLRPANPLGWPDRAHFRSALHAAEHRDSSAGPLLVGDPLVPQGLRERGIARVEAKLEVGADGKVTGVTLPEDGSIPAAMAPALSKALQRAVFAPAVDHGQLVAGTYAYRIEVKP